jgi:hypothetical protein
MKTAVEWLVKELESMDTKYYNSLIQIEMDRDNFIQICEQAKEVEKQQMKIACIRTEYEDKSWQKLMEKQFEQWYNETFKNE